MMGTGTAWPKKNKKSSKIGPVKIFKPTMEEYRSAKFIEYLKRPEFVIKRHGSIKTKIMKMT
jgi:hypothetical protein